MAVKEYMKALYTLPHWKKIALTSLCGLISLSSLHAKPLQAKKAPTSDDYYKAGITAIAQGNESKARQYFQASLKLDPNNGNAKYQLKNLHLHRGKMSQKARQNKLSSVIIPEVKLTDATLDEALSALTALVDDVSGKKVITNFVVQDPQNTLKTKRITLNVSNLPASAILDFILRSSAAKAQYDQYAIIITPIGTGQ